MANQLQCSVYSYNGTPFTEALTMYFPTNLITVQAATSPTISEVAAQINYYPNPSNQLQVVKVLVSESVSDLATLASTSMFAATIFQIDGYPQNEGLDMLFPCIQPSLSGASGTNVNSKITFKGTDYYAEETLSDLATAANAGGGGGGGIQTVSVTLDNDQIKALPTDSVEILETPGDGKVVILVNAILELNFSGGLYTNGSANVYMLLTYGDYDVECSAVCIFPIADQSDLITVLPPYTIKSAIGGQENSAQNFLSLKSLLNNKNVKLYCSNGNSGNFEDGNVDNTLTVTINYIIKDL